MSWVMEFTAYNTVPFCQWLQGQDILIQLALPAKYAEGYSSYEVGFLCKSRTGEVFRQVRLARKQCNYTVGFSREEFSQCYDPIIIYAEKNSRIDFTCEGDLIRLVRDNPPPAGMVYTLYVNGETPSGTHYNMVK